MFKKIISLLLCLNTLNAHAITYGGREVQADYLTGIKTVRNYIKNYGGEHNTNNVTGTNVTVSRNTTTPIDGVADFSFTIDSATDVVSWSTNTLDKKLSGQNCEAKISYTADANASNVKFGVYQGSNLVSSVALINSSTPKIAQLNYPCGDLSSATTLKIYGNAATSTVMKVDSVQVGEALNVGTVAQAQLIGSMSIGASSCTWTNSSAVTTFSDFPVNASCNSYTVTGSAQAPATTIPGVLFSSLPLGEYMVVAIGSYRSAAGNSNAAEFQISDGTNALGGAPVGSTSQASANQIYGQTLIGRINYTTPQTNITFRIKSRTKNGFNAGSQLLDGNDSTMPFQMMVYYFPSSAQQAVKVDQTPASWSGSLVGAGGGWSTTATASIADFSVATTSTTITQISAKNMTCVAESTKLPAITCTLPKAGTYQVCANAPIYNNGAGNAALYWQITDGSNNAVSAQQGINLAQNIVGSAQACGLYNASAAGSTTFKYRGYANQITTFINQATAQPMNWTVVALDQGMAVPYLQGNVTSNTSGQERIERVRVTSTCSSSPCTIASQSGSWLTSVSRSGTGTYALNIASGIFSAAPTCTCSLNGATFTCANVVGVSATSVTFTTNNAGGTLSDGSFNLICMGPR